LPSPTPLSLLRRASETAQRQSEPETRSDTSARATAAKSRSCRPTLGVGLPDRVPATPRALRGLRPRSYVQFSLILSSVLINSASSAASGLIVQAREDLFLVPLLVQRQEPGQHVVAYVLRPAVSEAFL